MLFSEKDVEYFMEILKYTSLSPFSCDNLFCPEHVDLDLAGLQVYVMWNI